MPPGSSTRKRLSSEQTLSPSSAPSLASTTLSKSTLLDRTALHHHPQSSIMPKVAGRFRAAAKTSSLRDVKLGAPPDAAESSSEKEAAALSRGQRKRLAKREQYLKREKMVMSSLRLQRLEQEKGKLDGLLAIREALGEACSSQPPKSLASDAKETKSDAMKKPTCNTNRSKKAIANREISQMGLVLEHPSFRENPFAAIQQHLRNSLAPEAEQMKQKSQKRDVEDDEVEAKKKEERKERLREAKFSKKKKGRGFRSNRSKR